MNTTQKAFLIAGIVFLCGGLGLLGARLLPGFNLTSGSEQEAFTQLREADEYLRQNSIDSARRASVIFNRVRARDVSPRINHLAEYGLAVALEKMGDRAAALSTYRKLRDEGVDDSELSEKVDYSLGKLFLYINHEEEGRSLLEALLARTRDEHLKSRIHTAYGVFYMKKGDRQRAEENFRVALKYNPENLQAEQLRAAAVQGQGRDWAAYEYYDDYLVGNANLEPHERQHLMGELRSEAYNSGIRSYRAGKYTEAVEFFRRVLLERVDDELNEKALYWTAESLAGAGNEAAALNAYDAVLTNASMAMDQPALIKKGILLFNKNRYEEAAASFQKAIDDYPDGDYIEKAIEWRRETRAMIREQSVLENARFYRPGDLRDGDFY